VALELIHDRDRLVAALRDRGVDYLMPEDAAGAPVGDEALIASLAANEDPRLRQALIALLMLEPHLAEYVPAIMEQLDEPARIELIAHYMAAVYSQSMWRIRLDNYLPPTPDLPDFYSEQLQLPSPDDEYGKAGLYALANWHARQVPWHSNKLSEYESVPSLLFGRLMNRARRKALQEASLDTAPSI
jgi:hypothetical protein